MLNNKNKEQDLYYIFVIDNFLIALPDLEIHAFKDRRQGGGEAQRNQTFSSLRFNYFKKEEQVSSPSLSLLSQRPFSAVPPKMGTTDSSSSGSIVMLIVILLGIAIPIIVFWVLIVWCSRRKRKRMAAFNKAAANADPVADDVEAPPAADGAPAARSPNAEGGAAPTSKKSEVKSVEKSGKSAKSKEQTQTGGDEKTT
ncbi:hypothetical protein CRE_06062 [Caenorhabditis remanei]|uniref:Uncharacterized protein n=2 Tax=Caenorhabditis remanei TaxID=31234 RepID=E3NAZ1_CAERE|nr:hypothetical protein CRE_06062 [Caenorhabditis remanei]